MQRVKAILMGGSAWAGLSSMGAAIAQDQAAPTATSLLDSIDPVLAGAAGAVALSVAAVLWAIRVSAASKTQTVHWSRRLAEMEAQLEKSDAVLSAHPGLVLVWEDDNEAIERGWGAPKILGGPAALASLLSFSNEPSADNSSPVDRLLESLGDLPVEDDNAPEEETTLRKKVHNLRAHGVAFSGSIVTTDGRAIEADGRVAGGQVALWLTDPAVRMAEDGAIVGTIRERTTDLHGSHVLLERAPMPAWRRSADLKLVWVNRAYVDAVEASTASEVIKQQIEIDAAARNIAENSAKEQQPAEGRVVVNIRGERRVLHIAEMPMHASGDAALGGIAIDRTELDRTRGELQQHIDANKRTLDQIPSAVALFGASQQLVYYNKAFQDLWGLEDASLGGRVYHGEILDKLRHDGILPEPADYDEWKASQLALYTEELSAPGSERDGGAPDEIWHLPDSRTLRVARQRHPLGGVLAVFEDITEKVSLEARFNTQINVQRATLNNLEEGVAVFAADGSLRLHNEAFQKLWRFSDKALKANPHVDDIVSALLQKCVKGGEDLSLIKRSVTSKAPEDRKPIEDGVVLLQDGRTFSYGTEPLPDGATLAHFLNITDSMEREKELKERNAILENADRLKSKFVDHVSYQLRTPLSTIIGFSEMLDGQMFGVLNDRQKDYVASVLSASYHLRDLINDIIDLAAIDAGKMNLERSATDIRGLLENAATYAALKAEDTQVTLKVDCSKDIGEAEVDERRLKQMLFNLLSNAFAYSGTGGEVTLGADRENGMLRIWVSDTGRGISPEDQAKAFDAFESRGPSAGAGLGLSLVERFTKLHGGWVRMDSREGSGAKVTCFIPDAPAKPKTSAEPKKAKPKRQPQKKKAALKPTAKGQTKATQALQPPAQPAKRPHPEAAE